MKMNQIRRVQAGPCCWIQGLGGTWSSWRTIIDDLARERQVIPINLPGFGKTAPLSGEVSIPTLADAVTDFLKARQLTGIDMAGSSIGARLVLEPAAACPVRRSSSNPAASGKVGSVVPFLCPLDRR
jgi:pimeloyl-ACP methyl ester carboxylesterase